MYDRRWKHEPTAYDDDWEDIPAAGAIPKWGGGIFLLPIGLIGYGLVCMVSAHGAIHGRAGSMEVFGPNAIALGLASASIGVFLHCHYFWGNIHQQAALAVLGKIVSLISMIGSLVFLFIHVGIFGH